MTTHLKQYRRLCAGRRRRSGRYREPAREAGARHAAEVLETGGTLAGAAVDLGLRERTVVGWLDELNGETGSALVPATASGFATVEVLSLPASAGRPNRSFSVESAEGLRVSGLELGDVITILRGVAGC